MQCKRVDTSVLVLSALFHLHCWEPEGAISLTSQLEMMFLGFRTNSRETFKVRPRVEEKADPPVTGLWTVMWAVHQQDFSALKEQTNKEKLTPWHRWSLQVPMRKKHSWAQVMVSRGVSKWLALRELECEPSSKLWPACCHVIPVHFVPKHSSRLLCHRGNSSFYAGIPHGW